MNTQFKTKQKFSFKQILLASFLAVSLPAASQAYAQQDNDKGQRCERGDQSHRGMHEGKPAYLRGLDLTSAQQDQLFNLNYPQVPAMREQHKQQQQLREDLRAIAQAEKFDDAKAQQLADKAAKLEKEKVLARARHEAKVFALLTPEQRKKAREFKDERGFGRVDGRHGGERDDNNRPARFKQQHRSTEYRAM